jgi:hypothetical protein
MLIRSTICSVTCAMTRLRGYQPPLGDGDRRIWRSPRELAGCCRSSGKTSCDWSGNLRRSSRRRSGIRGAWIRPAVAIRGMLAAKILQRLRQRHTPAGAAANHVRNVPDRLPLQIRIHLVVYALCQGLLEHAAKFR